jgi:hypothetical protein
MDVLNNPDIKAAVLFEEVKNQLCSNLAEQLMGTKTWSNMNKKERDICLKHVVSQVESEQELTDRLRADFGITYAAINWYKPDDGDQTGQEALMFVQALGGLVSKNGAMVMIMTRDYL